MVSVGITALLKKMDYKDVVVAVDGSVFRFHPHFPNIVKSRIAQLMGTDYQVKLSSVISANELMNCQAQPSPTLAKLLLGWAELVLIPDNTTSHHHHPPVKV